MNQKKSIAILIFATIFLLGALWVTKLILSKDKWLYYNILFEKYPDKFTSKQWVNLDGHWSLKQEDSSIYARPETKDESWNVDRYLFMTLLKKESSYIWFRKHFIAPSRDTKDSMLLKLSVFSSQVQVFLNGTRIADSCFLWDKSYCCRVPVSLIHLGKENLIALRAKCVDKLDVQSTSTFKDELIQILVPKYSLEGKWLCSEKHNIIPKDSFNDANDSSLIIPMKIGSAFKTGKDIWIRKTFLLPKMNHQKLLLVLGKINAYFEVYLNGVRLGGTIPLTFNGDLPPVVEHFNGCPFDSNLLKDKNQIAIRLLNSTENFSFLHGPIGILPIKDFFKFIDN